MTSLAIGQRLCVHCPTKGGSTFDRFATMRGFENGEALVRFDDQGYAWLLPSD